MKMPFRSIGRFLFLLLVIVLLVVGGILAWFTSWRTDRLAILEEGSEIVETKLGPVEYAIRGEGPAVLIFHGTPGGYDQALLFGAPLAEKGFTVIAASRPGYLRTPLSSGLLPGQQADLLAALLDSLGEKKVAVIGVSGGAPSAIEFVLSRPDRVWAFALIGGVTKKLDPWLGREFPHPGDLILDGLTGDIGSWLAVEMAHHDPRKLIENMLAAEGVGDTTSRYLFANAVERSPAQTEWLGQLVSTFAPLSPRETGARNDVLMRYSLPVYPFKSIAVPTLIIHGTADKNFPIADAKAAADLIPGAQFMAVEGAGQLVFLGPKGPEAKQSLVDFLRQQAGLPATTP